MKKKGMINESITDTLPWKWVKEMFQKVNSMKNENH